MSTYTYKKLDYPQNLLFDVFEENTAIPPDIDKALEEVFLTLTEREQACLLYRYKDKMNYDEIAKTYGVTRERVRQVIAKTLRKLRHPSRSRLLQHGYAEVERIKAKEAEARELAKLEIQRKQNLENRDISEFDLSVRTYNCLSRAGLKTYGDVISYGVENLHKIRNMGKKSIEEIKSKFFSPMEIEVKKPTNFEHIKNMTMLELANFLIDIEYNDTYILAHGSPKERAIVYWIEWFEQGAK